MNDPKPPPPAGPPPARRPYQPPAIEETSQFETLALACAQNAQNCGNYYEPDPSQYDNS